MIACPNCGFTGACADMLDVVSVAQRLGVSRQAVHNWIEEGKLPGAVRESDGSGSPGGKAKWMIPVEAVEALTAERDAL